MAAIQIRHSTAAGAVRNPFAHGDNGVPRGARGTTSGADRNPQPIAPARSASWDDATGHQNHNDSAANSGPKRTTAVDADAIAGIEIISIEKEIPTVPMPTTLNPTISAITQDTASFAPAVLAGVQAAQLANVDGGTKQEAVVNAVLGTTGALESNSNPNVAGIAALANLFVNIFNTLGVFKHKTVKPITVSNSPAA